MAATAPSPSTRGTRAAPLGSAADGRAAVPVLLPSTGPVLAPVAVPIVLAFVVAPVGTVLAAAMVPATLVVVSLAVFGVTHLALETRYVIGRFAPARRLGVAALVVVPLTVIAALRVLAAGRPAVQAEALIGLGLLGVGWVAGVHGRGTWRPQTIGLLVVGAVVVGAIGRPELYLVVLAHAHNVTPAAFVWEWSRSLPTRSARRLVRLGNLAWIVVVPTLVLSGALDGLLRGSGGWSGDRTVVAIATVYTPHGWSEPWPQRFLVLFCVGQLMHYVIWCGLFPAVAAADHRRAGTLAAIGPLLRRRLFVPFASAVAVLIGGLQLVSGRLGRRWYGALAAFHVYLELPILALLASALVLGARTRTETA